MTYQPKGLRGLLVAARAWWHYWHEKRRERRRQELDDAINKETQHRITLTYFNGGLYVAMDNVPLFKCQDIDTAAALLNSARKYMCIWRHAHVAKANIF